MKRIFYTLLLSIIILPALANVSERPCTGSNGTISGDTSVLIGDTETYTWSTSGTQCSQYDWYIVSPSGGTITSSGQTSATIDWEEEGTYTIKYYNGLVIPPSATLSVTVTDPCPPSAPTGSDVENCGTGSVTLTASPGTGGSVVRWYLASTGGTVQSTGTTFNTPNISTTTSYWAATYNSSGDCESTRTEIQAIINPIPGAPSNAVGADRCDTGTLTLSASYGSNGNTLKWYDSNDNYLATGTSYTTPSISQTTNYKVKSYNSTTGCEGTATLTVQAKIVTTPTITTENRFGAGDVTLSATTNGDGVKWYRTSTGGFIKDGSSLDVYLENTTTYYAASEGTSCTTGKTSAIATVETLPVVSSSTTRNIDDSPILSTGSYNSYQWNKDGSAISGATSSTYTPTTEGVYTVTVTKTGTTGSGTSLPFTIHDLDFTDMNYMRSKSLVEKVNEGATEALTETAVNNADKITQTNYLTGSGSSLQRILHEASPGSKDVVTPIEYDEIGRQAKQYLPYAMSSANSTLAFQEDALTSTYTSSDQYGFYTNTSTTVPYDTKPYIENEFEKSPTSRITKADGVGSDWDGKYFENDYELSTESVDLWYIDSGLPKTTATYANYELIIQITKDPENGESKTYMDSDGNTVLRKSKIDATTWAETYYVFDDLGQLRFILPPVLVENHSGTTVSQDELDRWAYQYKYDEYGRVIESKVPGTGSGSDDGWVYTVYDQLDRPILTQDGEQRTTDEWSFIKYDIYGRPIMTGVVDLGAISRTTAQTNSYNDDDLFENSTTDATGYSLNISYPTVAEADLYTVKYYDNYDFTDNTGWDAESNSYDSEAELNFTAEFTRIDGLLTGTKVRNLGDNKWLNSVVYYDKYHRIVQAISENQFNEIDRYTIEYSDDLQSLVEKTLLTHNSDSETDLTVHQRFTYDHMGRVLKEYHQVGDDSGDEKLIASYFYNELGQLVEKDLHSEDGTNFKQSLDYRFNIRGMLTSINNSTLTNDSGSTNDDTNDYFGMEIAYQQDWSSDLSTQDNLYNGLISAVKWKNSAGDQKAYTYDYFYNGWLKEADYLENPTGSSWSNPNDFDVEGLTYDRNGNILTLDRYSSTGAKIDDLSYDYGTGTGQSNKLLGVTDSGNDDLGFKEFNASGNDYEYDIRGNIKKDKHKGISSISYNHFNKVETVTNENGETVDYVYDGTGTLLYKEVENNSITTQKTIYSGGFIYEAATMADTVAHFDFEEGIEGWTAVSQINFFTNNTGEEIITGVVTGSSPKIKSPNSLGFEADVYSQIRLRMENNIGGTGGTIHFKRTDATTGSKTFTLEANGAFMEYVIDMSTVAAWTGEMDYIEIQLPGSSGGFEIDYISIEKPARTTPKLTHLSTSGGLVVFEDAFGADGRTGLYQYNLTDHLGNTRVAFVEGEQVFEATMETENSTEEDAQFNNISPVTFVSANHTTGGNEVIRLNKDNTIGPSIGLKVFPGDKVNAQAYAYYEGGSDYGTSVGLSSIVSSLATAFGGSSGGGGESGFIYDFFDDGLTTQGLAGNNGSTVPAGYLNWILFDKEMQFEDAGYKSITSAADYSHELISLSEISITEEGYLYIYISHESQSNSYVYWDDFKVTYEYDHTVQEDDYYPFGMRHDKRYTEAPTNKYLFNGNSELNTKLGVYETPFRQYDPALGRFNGIDALAPAYHQMTPYQFGTNNPISFNDPTGLYRNAPLRDMWQEAMQWAQMANEGANQWFDGFNNWYNTRAGSGNHWMDGMRSKESQQYTDMFMMTTKNFEDKYGVTTIDYMSSHNEWRNSSDSYTFKKDQKTDKYKHTKRNRKKRVYHGHGVFLAEETITSSSPGSDFLNAFVLLMQRVVRRSTEKRLANTANYQGYIYDPATHDEEAKFRPRGGKWRTKRPIVEINAHPKFTESLRVPVGGRNIVINITRLNALDIMASYSAVKNITGFLPTEFKLGWGFEIFSDNATLGYVTFETEADARYFNDYYVSKYKEIQIRAMKPFKIR